jgi:hypothetical protein
VTIKRPVWMNEGRPELYAELPDGVKIVPLGPVRVGRAKGFW